MQGVCLKASPHYEYQLNLHIKRFNFSECPIYSDLTSSTFIHQYEKQIDHPRKFFSNRYSFRVTFFYQIYKRFDLFIESLNIMITCYHL